MLCSLSGLNTSTKLGVFEITKENFVTVISSQYWWNSVTTIRQKQSGSNKTHISSKYPQLLLQEYLYDIVKTNESLSISVHKGQIQ